MTAASLSHGQSVEIYENAGRIIIESILTPDYNLDDLLDQLKPESFHESEDFGDVIGNEVW